jgi:hypothetical protein
MRKLLSSAFREKASVADLHQINRLIALGRMDLEETLMLWKARAHTARQGFAPDAGAPLSLACLSFARASEPSPLPHPEPLPAADPSAWLAMRAQGESHVMQMFDLLLEKEERAASAPPTFLDKFFDGK